MIKYLCALWGHRRDKSSIRPFKDTWRSKCKSCDAPIKKTPEGKWTPIATSEMSFVYLRPILQQNIFPFARPVCAEPRENHQAQPFAFETSFAEELVNAVVTKLASSADRRGSYLTRADEARVLAEQAPEHYIKVIHLEMATRYYSLANIHFDQSAPSPAQDRLQRTG
ncbi:MAG: hypothetical protein LH610_10875 [Sphingomonas bacterium]|nr:hypothetical protein [Sphingomonas bacterium]